MNNFIKFALSGLAGGVLGGMGMGGGTVLIPILTVFLSVAQKPAQAINLISFIPMAIVALIMHFKNKLVRLKNILYIIIPACVSAVGGGALLLITDSTVLKRIFGGFLIALSVFQFFTAKNGLQNNDKK